MDIEEGEHVAFSVLIVPQNHHEETVYIDRASLRYGSLDNTLSIRPATKGTREVLIRLQQVVGICPASLFCPTVTKLFSNEYSQISKLGTSPTPKSGVGKLMRQASNFAMGRRGPTSPVFDSGSGFGLLLTYQNLPDMQDDGFVRHTRPDTTSVVLIPLTYKCDKFTAWIRWLVNHLALKCILQPYVPADRADLQLPGNFLHLRKEGDVIVPPDPQSSAFHTSPIHITHSTNLMSKLEGEVCITDVKMQNLFEILPSGTINKKNKHKKINCSLRVDNASTSFIQDDPVLMAGLYRVIADAHKVFNVGAKIDKDAKQVPVSPDEMKWNHHQPHNPYIIQSSTYVEDDLPSNLYGETLAFPIRNEIYGLTNCMAITQEINLKLAVNGDKEVAHFSMKLKDLVGGKWCTVQLPTTLTLSTLEKFPESCTTYALVCSKT